MLLEIPIKKMANRRPFNPQARLITECSDEPTIVFIERETARIVVEFGRLIGKDDDARLPHKWFFGECFGDLNLLSPIPNEREGDGQGYESEDSDESQRDEPDHREWEDL